jgi:hypothetical protein
VRIGTGRIRFRFDRFVFLGLLGRRRFFVTESFPQELPSSLCCLTALDLRVALVFGTSCHVNLRSTNDRGVESRTLADYARPQRDGRITRPGDIRATFASLV